MRTNLTDDSKIITLWPAESISRGDRSRLPFRRIWQSTRPNFSPCSQPQHFRTLQRIFSRELAWVRSHRQYPQRHPPGKDSGAGTHLMRRGTPGFSLAIGTSGRKNGTVTMYAESCTRIDV